MTVVLSIAIKKIATCVSPNEKMPSMLNSPVFMRRNHSGGEQGVVEAWFSRNHGKEMKESRKKVYILPRRLFVPVNVVRILICIHPTVSVASLKSAACRFVLDRYQTQTLLIIRRERRE